jgi:uncharacterized protein DUF6894
MPRYYFDIDDGKRFTRDEAGHEFPTPKAMRDAAVGVLPNIARNEMPAGDRCVFSVKVRDGDSRYLLSVSLLLVVEWLDEAPTPQ